MIDKKWRLHFNRDRGWWGSAETNSMTATIRISTDKRYPTFEDCHAVLEGKIKLHEEAKTQ